MFMNNLNCHWGQIFLIWYLIVWRRVCDISFLILHWTFFSQLVFISDFLFKIVLDALGNDKTWSLSLHSLKISFWCWKKLCMLKFLVCILHNCSICWKIRSVWVGKFELTLGGIPFEGYSSSVKKMKHEEIFLACRGVKRTEDKMIHAG